MLNAAGLAYALVLDSNLRMKGLIRTIVYLPAIISPLIIGYIWSIILSSENGVLLECMKMLGLEAFFSDLLADPSSALCVIIVVHVWQYLGGNMIIIWRGFRIYRATCWNRPEWMGRGEESRFCGSNSLCWGPPFRSIS